MDAEQKKILLEVIENHPLVRTGLAENWQTFLAECRVYEIWKEKDRQATTIQFSYRILSRMEYDAPALLPVFTENYLSRYGKDISNDQRTALESISRHVRGSEMDNGTGPLKDGDNFIIDFYNRAAKSVPSVKYAGAVGAVAAVIAIVTQKFGLPEKTVAIGLPIAFALMVIMVVFARFSESKEEFRWFVKIFVGFEMLLFMAASALLLTSAFFDWPRPLSQLF